MSLLQVASLAIGLALLAFVLFSYDSEERQAADWVDAVFRKLFEHDKRFSARVLGAMQSIAILVDKLFNSVYGQRIAGWHALRVAASLSMGVALFVWPL